MSPVNTVHGTLASTILRDLGNACDLLRALLPESLAERVAWSTLRLEASDYLRPAREAIRGDFLFRVETQGAKPVTLLVPLEHQSASHRWMPLRAGDYSFGAWWTAVREEPGPGDLPIVVPVVLHHGAGGWSAARTMHELVAASLEAHPELAPFVPNARFVLDDLATLSDEAIAARSKRPALLVALWLLRDARDAEKLHASMPRWAPPLAELLAEPTLSPSAEALVAYLFHHAEEPSRLALESFLDQTHQRAKGNLMTIEEMLIKRGEERGLALGEARGQALGEARGQALGALTTKRAAVLAVFEARALALTPEQRARIEASTNTAELDGWHRAAITAPSAEAVFGS